MKTEYIGICAVVVYVVIGYLLSIWFYAKCKVRENIILMTVLFGSTWVIGVLYILITAPHTLARKSFELKQEQEKEQEQDQ